jgi:pimeloyl-ACP methyl ester carboxylesterase
MARGFDASSVTRRKVRCEALGAAVEVAIVRRAARGPGRRAVLLHGNPSRSDHWADVAAHLGPGELVAIDHPGFGDSGPLAPAAPTLHWSAEAMLGALDALDALDGAGGAARAGEAFDLVGHSHGGLVAVAMAALAPSRVASLVFLSTGGTPAHLTYRLLPGRAVRAALGAYEALLRGARGGSRASEWAVRASARALFAPEAPPAGYGRAEFEALRRRPDLLGAMARLTLADPCAEVVDYARRVRAPSLFVHGRRDPVVPVAYARRLAAVLEGAGAPVRFEEIDGGHMLHVTRAERVGRLVGAWRERSPG